MKKLLFIVNPKAGKTTIKDNFFDIIETFSMADFKVETYVTRGPGDAERYIVENGEQFDVIACAGGDGTLDNSVSGIIELKKKTGKDIPLGYIPCGSTNDFARSFGISREPVEAAKAIAEGEILSCDVGKFQDTEFIYVAAFGTFTDISYSTPQKLKNALGHSAYVLEAFKSISRLKAYNIKGDFDGKTVTGEYIYCQITNSLSVGGFRAIGTKHMSFDDGVFECLLIRKPNSPSELQRIITSILEDELDRDLIVYEKASKITIECEEEIPWTIDGEFGGNLKDVEINNLHRAVHFYVKDKQLSPDPNALEKYIEERIEEMDKRRTEIKREISQSITDMVYSYYMLTPSEVKSTIIGNMKKRIAQAKSAIGVGESEKANSKDSKDTDTNNTDNLGD